MSGAPWWPDKDRHTANTWAAWHSPTYEDKKDSNQQWHKSWNKTWDWGSPTGAAPRKKLTYEDSPDPRRGHKSHLPVRSKTEVEIPDEFDTDDKFVDKNKRCGKDFPRYISTSSWSLKHSFASRDVLDLRISEMCYLGVHNISLRYLAHGYPTSLIMTRGIKESILGEKLLKELRGLGMDLDVLAKLVVEQESGAPVDTSTLELKTETLSRLASIMISKVTKAVPAASMNLKRVKELESEINEAKGLKRDREPGQSADETQSKIFKTDSAPAGHTPKAVSTWIDSLKLTKDEKKKLKEDVEKMSKLESEDLQSKLLSMGLPMKVVAAMKKSELGRVLAAGFLRAASKA